MRRVDASLTDHLRSRLEQALAPPGPPVDAPADAAGDRPRRALPGPPTDAEPTARPRRARWVADLHEAAIRTVLRPPPPVASADGAGAEDPDRPPDPVTTVARTWPRRVTGRHVVVAMSVLTVAVILTTVTVLAARDRPVAAAAPQLSAVSQVSVTPDVGATPAPPAGPATAATNAAPPPPASSGSAAVGLTVHVAGAVRRPGVVQLPAGARVHDAVDAAGGFAPQAVPGALNLAQPLGDGQQVYVSDRVDPPSEVRGAGAAGAPGGGSTAGGGVGTSGPSGDEGPLDLNAATLEQLESLPGVGPVTAAAILAWREEHGRFSSVDELQEVDGIGPKTYQRLAPLVRV